MDMLDYHRCKNFPKRERVREINVSLERGGSTPLSLKKDADIHQTAEPRIRHTESSV